MNEIINFNNSTEYKSQQTLVKLLEEHSFYFEPINEYDNNMFYLIIQYTEKKRGANFFNKFFGWAHKVDEDKIFERRLSYLTWDDNGFEILKPCVYTRQDISNILSDTNLQYIGPATL